MRSGTSHGSYSLDAVPAHAARARQLASNSRPCQSGTLGHANGVGGSDLGPESEQVDEQADTHPPAGQQVADAAPDLSDVELVHPEEAQRKQQHIRHRSRLSLHDSSLIITWLVSTRVVSPDGRRPLPVDSGRRFAYAVSSSSSLMTRLMVVWVIP